MQINPDGTLVIDADYRARVDAALELEVRPAMARLLRSPIGRRIFDELVGAHIEGDATDAAIVFELRDGTLIGVPFSLVGRVH